jgi:hypothetical protein
MLLCIRSKTCTFTLRDTIYFFFLFFPPPPESFASDAIAPWVAPPDFFFLPPVSTRVRSDFLIQRSGSGGGVTPGMTPLGMRDFRGAFCLGDTIGSVEVTGAAYWGNTDCSDGRGAPSRVCRFGRGGSWCTAVKKPVVRKATCVSAAWMLTWISSYSSWVYVWQSRGLEGPTPCMTHSPNWGFRAADYTFQGTLHKHLVDTTQQMGP